MSATSKRMSFACRSSSNEDSSEDDDGATGDSNAEDSSDDGAVSHSKSAGTEEAAPSHSLPSSPPTSKRARTADVPSANPYVDQAESDQALGRANTGIAQPGPNGHAAAHSQQSRVPPQQTSFPNAREGVRQIGASHAAEHNTALVGQQPMAPNADSHALGEHTCAVGHRVASATDNVSVNAASQPFSDVHQQLSAAGLSFGAEGHSINADHTGLLMPAARPSYQQPYSCMPFLCMPVQTAAMGAPTGQLGFSADQPDDSRNQSLTQTAFQVTHLF